jgi:hypothetical protein
MAIHVLTKILCVLVVYISSLIAVGENAFFKPHPSDLFLSNEVLFVIWAHLWFDWLGDLCMFEAGRNTVSLEVCCMAARKGECEVVLDVMSRK